MPEEKILIVNLRKDLIESPKWERRRRAVRLLKDIVERKFKPKQLVVDKSINEKIWSNGKKLPMKFKVKLVKSGDKLRIELV